MTIKQKEVLVTGGTGFIGRSLVKKLVNSGYRIRVLTRQPDKQNAILSELGGSRLTYVRGDIGMLEDIVCASAGVETIFHLASAMGGSWDEYQNSTIRGMENTLRACERNNIKSLIYVSTINVYDAKNYPDGAVIDESFQYEDQPERRGSYSNAKLVAERMLLDNKSILPASTTIIRPGLVYGKKKNFMPLDAGKILLNRFIIVFGMGNRRLPVVYIENLIDALLLSADSNTGNERKRIFNIVDDDYPVQHKFISCYSRLINRKLIPVYVPVILLRAAFFLADKIMFVFSGKKMNLLYKLNAIVKTPVFSTENAKKTIKWHQKNNFEDGMKYSLGVTRGD